MSNLVGRPQVSCLRGVEKFISRDSHDINVGTAFAVNKVKMFGVKTPPTV